MKKGWKQKRIKENAWSLHFDRWYLIAPSGNKYYFYRNCYFPTIRVPITYNALSSEHKDEVPETEFKIFRKVTGKKTRHVSYTFDEKLYEYDDIIDDRYEQALTFIYSIEESGGFPEQNKMNAYLSKNREMTYLFSQTDNTVKYNSMP